MVAVFSVLPAATIPGQSQGTPASSAGIDSSSSSSSTVTDDGQLQPPANGPFQFAGGNPPVAVSGGSRQRRLYAPRYTPPSPPPSRLANAGGDPAASPRG